ncbi:MAG: T9SS type A sorting domain-containing protein, partial [Lentimicrobium sp.]|nr:T9SS type A sorting domain-containing protein [Lentimicrobium sp.]
QGFLSHSYEAPSYGIQTVNFGESTYNWAAMGDAASSAGYQDIATLMYHAGVSVDMNYNLNGSGASYEAARNAFATYFNYDPLIIALSAKADYNETNWKEMLKTELHASRPVLYGGDNNLSGHAWVCDGWRWSDDMFHMNWGWSGAYNGWFRMGQLNTGSGSYNNNNVAITGIKPGNSNLVVRITNLSPNQLIACNSNIAIDCSVITGTTGTVNLYLDNTLIYTSSQSDFSYNLNTTGYTLGSHTIKVEAIHSTDTAYHQVIVRNSEWISQASAFASPSRGIMYLHAVDSLVVWATAYDGLNVNNPIQEFTHTENGGETWTSGVIPECSGLAPSMIFALNSDTAYCPMYRVAGSNPKGIYYTADGGNSWVRQATASFSDAASFPNVVHFFDTYHGFCAGDPVAGEYEIYTTDNGGITWTPVAADNIQDPIFGEFGIVGYYSAFGDKAWFGTSNGKVYRTNDRGHHWEASLTQLNGKYVDVKFANELHGLAQDKSTNSTGALSETFDGGVTWTLVNPSGPVGATDLCFVPGTENTWVSTNAFIWGGAFYSFDGGHSWAPFNGVNTLQFMGVDFSSNSCGWAGTFNTSSSVEGMFKYVGSIPDTAALSPVSDLLATVNDRNVLLEWIAPAFGTVLGYNVYRSDTLLTMVPVTGTVYNDNQVASGQHNYCVKAVYTAGESSAVCTEVWVNAGVLSPVSNLIASIEERNVYLEWTAPAAGSVLGYNVYRGDTLLNMFPFFGLDYNDLQVNSGHHTYCVKAVYTAGESNAVCTEVWITYGISEMEAAVKVYPNPAGEVINIETPVNFSKVRILTVLGQEVYTYTAPANRLKILTAGFKPGIYLIQMAVGDKTFARRISIK